MPLNRNNSHWSFCKIDLSLKTIFSFDSYFGEEMQRENAREIIKLIEKMMEAKCDYTISIQKTLKQTNSFDCGPHMIKNLEIECLGSKFLYLDSLSSLEMRLMIAIQLLESKIYLNDN